MKKSLWGYNVQEVDETMEYFEANQAKLNKKVKQLTEEMDSVRKELDGKNQTIEEQAQAHAQELQVAADEKASLEAKIKELAAVVAEYDQTKDELDRVGEICKSAYEDMNQTKKSLRVSLTDFLEEFWKRWEGRLKKVEEMEKHLADINAQGKEEFLKFTEKNSSWFAFCPAFLGSLTSTRLAFLFLVVSAIITLFILIGNYSIRGLLLRQSNDKDIITD